MPSTDDAVSQNLIAALLLAATPHLRRLGLPHPTASAVLAATGAGRSRAYELATTIEASLNGVVRPVGRPRRPEPPVLGETSALSRGALDFLIAHPGAVTHRGGRRHYSDGYRALVLRLVDAHPERQRAHVAEAVGVPAATLDDWWSERERLASGKAPNAEPPAAAEDPITENRIAAILHLWRTWDGTFSAFADAVRSELQIPWGHTRIGTVLAVHGDRRPTRRPGRRPDEKALRGAFQTFFPGAQWSEDGTPLGITLNGERFTFNLELAVDTCSGAIVGGHVSSEENADAVVAAYQDAVETTGAPPLALGTDNATENAAAADRDPIRDALHIRATPGRPQNDAHVEGAFGLFQSVVPPLVVEAQTPRALAAALLALVVTTWARTLNHRPRKSRGGASRVELYREANPTEEQVAAAKEALRAIQAAHDRAEQTRRRRTDPVARSALDTFFAARHWDDPKGHLRDAIAGYGLDAVLAALAAWHAKERTARLPEGAAARYLLGITRNIQTERELAAMADELWKRRLDARELVLTRLDHERSTLRGSPKERLDSALGQLTRAESQLQRAVWASTVAEIVRSADAQARRHLHQDAVRTIAAAYSLEKYTRAALIRAVTERILPIAA